MRVFPVLGGARYSNDFSYPRSGGRSHQGNDLFNSEGTPLLAVDSGEVRFAFDQLGGNIANLRASDGTRYYYAHLRNFAGSNRQVSPGEVIGYLGKTGNAALTPPHLHFEVHPGGGAATNPFPLLQAAPVKSTAGGAPQRNLFWPVAIALGVGIAAWYWTNPAQARNFARRLAV